MSTEVMPAGGPAGMFFDKAGDDSMNGQETRIRTHAKLRGTIQSWLIMLPGLLLMTFFVKSFLTSFPFLSYSFQRISSPVPPSQRLVKLKR